MASLTHLFRTFQSAQVAFWRKARHSQPLCALRAAPMLALMAAITLVSGVSHAQWVQTGFPSTASSYSMVAKEGNLFLATWGNGVYESTDGGADWTAVNNGLDQWFYTHYVYALAVVPSTSGAGTNLFAGMEEGGIWRSTDDGASWTWVYPG
jgi:hypothetical protein